MNLTREVDIPKKINVGLSYTPNKIAGAILGNPRSNYTDECQDVSNPEFKKLISYGVDVGPFNVSGFHLAVESLAQVMVDIKEEQPEVYNGLSSAGMLCCRYVRGSKAAISNHSWGLAIDLKINGKLDEWKNGKVQYGLTLIAPIFNRHGWFWGAGYTREDGMHFEISEKKLRGWANAGKIKSISKLVTSNRLMFGDRSLAVQELQFLLNKLGEELATDGIFGPATHAALVAFQGKAGLVADGIVGNNTWKALRSIT